MKTIEQNLNLICVCFVVLSDFREVEWQINHYGRKCRRSPMDVLFHLAVIASVASASSGKNHEI